MARHRTMITSALVVLAVYLVGPPALDMAIGITARADDQGTGLFVGVNQLRQPCGALDRDARLTAAAQRHANDLLATNALDHTGSDGSSPQTRMADAGYGGARTTGEIVYRGTGSAGSVDAALASWMNSPGHRAIIVNCAFTSGGFATASDGNTMVSVGDFAAP